GPGRARPWRSSEPLHGTVCQGCYPRVLARYVVFEHVHELAPHRHHAGGPVGLLAVRDDRRRIDGAAGLRAFEQGRRIGGPAGAEPDELVVLSRPRLVSARLVSGPLGAVADRIDGRLPGAPLGARLRGRHLPPAVADPVLTPGPGVDRRVFGAAPVERPLPVLGQVVLE